MARMQGPLILKSLRQKIEEVEKLAVPKVDRQIPNNLESDQLDSSASIETILPSNLVRRPRWFTLIV